MNSITDKFESYADSVDGNANWPMLRELRRELLLEISGGEKRIANSEEIKSWILEKYQTNPLVGDIFRAILLINEDLVLSENELPSLAECKHSVFDAEKRPLPEFCFVSSRINGEPKGVLIQRESLKVGGLVYSFTIFSREHLTKSVKRIEIRACSKEPEPFASLFTSNGWVHVSQEEIHLEQYAIFALRCLISYHRYKYKKLPVDSLLDTRKERPRPNDYLVDLIARAYRNQVRCYKVEVPLTHIKPRDLDYALTIQKQEIKSFIDEICNYGFPFSELLLYQHGDELITDDDYIAYLSYMAMGLDKVPAVIIGAFNNPNVVVLSEGGEELIPPIGVKRVEESYPSIRSKEEILKEKLLSLSPKTTDSSRLEKRFIEFCRLIGNSSTSEAELHKFLNRYPEIFDSHMASIHSEVTIGRYRADLVIRYEQVDKKIVLIELERHSDTIFTKANRIRKKVTHASQQVEDWINEIRLGAKNIPSWLSTQFCPEGLVVIGRSRDLTDEQKQILVTINSNRTVKIITYDDLLERMKQLMRMINRLD